MVDSEMLSLFSCCVLSAIDTIFLGLHFIRMNTFILIHFILAFIFLGYSYRIQSSRGLNPIDPLYRENRSYAVINTLIINNNNALNKIMCATQCKNNQSNLLETIISSHYKQIICNNVISSNVSIKVK